MARPRKADQIDVPARAVEAVVRLLDERDAADVTLADVAAAAGCRAPALYAYFANRDALLRAAHDDGFRILLREKLAVAARNTRDPLSQLREGGLAYLRFAFEHPGLYRLMFSPPSAEGGPDNPFASDPGAECLAMLRSASEACQAGGYLPGADATQVAFILWSAVHGAASLVLQGRAPLRAGGDSVAAAMGTVDTLMSFIERSRTSKPGSRFVE